MDETKSGASKGPSVGMDMHGELKLMYELLEKAEKAISVATGSINVLKSKVGMLHLRMDPEGELREQIKNKIYMEEVLKVTEIDGVDVMEQNGENGATIVSAYGHDLGDAVIVKGVVLHKDGVTCTTHPVGEVVGFTPGKILVEVELSDGDSEIIILSANKVGRIDRM